MTVMFDGMLIENVGGTKTGFFYYTNGSCMGVGLVGRDGEPKFTDMVELWSDGKIGFGPLDSMASTAEETVGFVVDSFANAYLEANPKR